MEALFQAYFLRGQDIGNPAVLIELARDIGLDPERVESYLASDTDVAAIFNENARAHRMGVNGVPCFIFNGVYAVAGAQEPDIFHRMIELAADTAPPGGVPSSPFHALPGG